MIDKVIIVYDRVNIFYDYIIVMIL